MIYAYNLTHNCSYLGGLQVQGFPELWSGPKASLCNIPSFQVTLIYVKLSEIKWQLICETLF